MAEDPLKEAAKVIPSVYYDLIARVAAGAAVIAAASWIGSLTIKSPGEHLVLLALGAYICGMLLTPFGALSGYGARWLVREILKWLPSEETLKNFSQGHLARRLVGKLLKWLPKDGDLEILSESELAKGPNDEISANNAEAGATIAKMQAEAALCHNMLVGVLVLPLFACPVKHWDYWRVAVIVLVIAALYRTAAYLVRQKQLYVLLNSQSGPVRAAASGHA
ncbi:hypothetical protein JQ625_10940 [Bradyrhizobium diazoefficiens]|nr:hypothetical protein [Bradyrhizobium diazoefficiens]MBR0775347.1 hypothetical protein [Bradyrhizobium diazoefficiens]